MSPLTLSCRVRKGVLIITRAFPLLFHNKPAFWSYAPSIPNIVFFPQHRVPCQDFGESWLPSTVVVKSRIPSRYILFAFSRIPHHISVKSRLISRIPFQTLVSVSVFVIRSQQKIWYTKNMLIGDSAFYERDPGIFLSALELILGTLRSNDADDNEKVKKTIGLISKTTTSHVHHTFLYISFPFLHDCDVKMPNFAFYGGRKQPTTKFYFSFWAWIWSIEIQLQEGSPTIDKVRG